MSNGTERSDDVLLPGDEGFTDDAPSTAGGATTGHKELLDEMEAMKGPGPDPWAHRSAGMKCRTCMWFVTKVASLGKVYDSAALGRCRKHAPTMGGYPAVFPTDWCGDHKLDENKI